jgi:hypothetical protein
MTKEEILKKINDWEEIKIYRYHKYIEAKVELGEDNLATQIAKKEWQEAVQKLSELLDFATKQKF